MGLAFKCSCFTGGEEVETGTDAASAPSTVDTGRVSPIHALGHITFTFTCTFTLTCTLTFTCTFTLTCALTFTCTLTFTVGAITTRHVLFMFPATALHACPPPAGAAEPDAGHQCDS